MKKGATANNWKGIAGVASGVKIMPVSICYTDDGKELGITPSTTANSGSAPATPVVKSTLSEVDPGDLSMMGLGYDKWNIAYLARDRGVAEFESDSSDPELHDIEYQALKNGLRSTSGIHIALISKNHSY